MFAVLTHIFIFGGSVGDACMDAFPIGAAVQGRMFDMKTPTTEQEIPKFIHNVEWHINRISNSVIFDEAYIRKNIREMDDSEYEGFYRSFINNFKPYIKDFRKYEASLQKLMGMYPDYPGLCVLQDKVIIALLNLNRIIDILEDEWMKRG